MLETKNITVNGESLEVTYDPLPNGENYILEVRAGDKVRKSRFVSYPPDIPWRDIINELKKEEGKDGTDSNL